MDSLVTRSSLETMLETMKQRDEQPKDLPPALPVRPNSIGRLPTSRFRALQGTLSVRKNCPDFQDDRDCLKMKKSAVKLQSFIRGERARYSYDVSLMRWRAAVVIQKHVRRWIARALVDYQQKEIAALQSDGSSKINHFKINRGQEKNLQNHIKDTSNEHPQMHPLVVELQRRLLEAEAALQEKEEENAILQEKLQQYDKRCLEYEKNMKSMEQTWQKQLTSLQMSLASTKMSLAPNDLANYQGRVDASPISHYYDCEDAMSAGNRTPEGIPAKQMAGNRTPEGIPAKQMAGKRTPEGIPDKQPTDAGRIRNNDSTTTSVIHLVKEFDQRRQVFDDDAGFLVQVKSGQLSSNINPNEELRKLKARFSSWKKDYKSRLRETKVALQKHGSSEEKKTWKKFWIRRH